MPDSKTFSQGVLNVPQFVPLVDNDDVVPLRPNLARAIGLNEELVLEQIWAAGQTQRGDQARAHMGRVFVFFPLRRFKEFLRVSRSEAYRVKASLVAKGILIQERIGTGRNAGWWFAVDTAAVEKACPLFRAAPPLRPPGGCCDK